MVQGSVIALAGRRPDPENAQERRFRADWTPHVGCEIRNALEQFQATALVCSAACGTDLLGLEAAGELGIHRRIVLPFDRDLFRTTSVVDRPGRWGDLYDRILNEVQATEDVVVLGCDPADVNAYLTTNKSILMEANSMAQNRNELLRALVVWDGNSRGPDDVTARFLQSAMEAGIPTTEIRLAA